jgi:hypothetical protein
MKKIQNIDAGIKGRERTKGANSKRIFQLTNQIKKGRPSPILSPESMRLARWQPRHRTPRLRGYVPAQGFNPTQTLCLIYRGAFVPLSFRVIALLPSHYRSVALFGYLLTRGGIFNE